MFEDVGESPKIHECLLRSSILQSVFQIYYLKTKFKSIRHIKCKMIYNKQTLNCCYCSFSQIEGNYIFNKKLLIKTQNNQNANLSQNKYQYFVK